MKVFQVEQTRQQYFQTQIARSDSKFRYCKVSICDVERYKSLILKDIGGRGGRFNPGPILCLGTRNGREVDLFRAEFFGSRFMSRGLKIFERQTHSFVPLLPFLEAVGRSNWSHLSPTSVVGVEVNPRAARPDIWVGSFDEMPAGWGGKFGVLFSNAFDQSHDPYKTAREWKRVTRPGGYVIFCFGKDTPPTMTDPVGSLHLKDVLELFGGDLVYYHERGSRSGYSEAIVRWAKACR